MSSIDSRVVEAKFKNDQFQKGVSDTIGSLDKLKGSLQMSGASKGLDDVQASASKFSLAGIANGVDSLVSKFSNMGVVGITALTNITNKAIDAGLEVAKSLTVDPIKEGFKSYTDTINATQVILANTKAAGSSLGDVTNTLADLQKYANQTVYSFSDMTQNIGRFTAAGVPLKDAQASIKGLANVAALSGASTEQMSSAMYQMSQALASGTVKLQDWNSLSNANMAGQGIQNALKETAKASADHGKAMDAAIKKDGDFRDSLKEGWLTSDIFNKTMGVMGGTIDQATGKFRAFSVEELKAQGYSQEAADSLHQLSADALNSAIQIRTLPQMMQALKEEVATAWGAVFKSVFGNIDQATSMFTAMHNVLENALTGPIYALNDLISDFNDIGGRSVVIDGLTAAGKLLMGVLNPIKEAFRDIFPKKTSSDLFSAAESFRNFMQDMVPGEQTMKNLTRTFEGLFAILHIGWTIIKAVGTFLFNLFAGLEEGNKGILQTTASIGDFFVGLDKAVSSGQGLTSFFNTVLKLLFLILNPLKDAGALFGSLLQGVNFDLAGSSLGKLVTGILQLGGAAATAKSPLNVALDVLGSFEAMAGKVADTVRKFAQNIAKAFSGLNFDVVMKGFQTGGIVAMAGTILQLTKAIKGFSLFGGKGGPGGLFDGIKEGLEGLNGTMKSMQNDNNASALMKLAAAIALLALAVMLLASIDPQALLDASAAMGVMFVELTKSIQMFNKAVGMMGAAKLMLLVPALIGIALAILLLAIAVKMLTTLGWEGLAKGLTGVAVLLGLLTASVKIMSENTKGMIKAAVGILAMAVAIDLLVIAVKIFAAMSWEEIAKGLTGVGAILLGLALFTRMAKTGKDALAQGAGILLMAGAILILSNVVEKLGSMSWADMTKGMVGMAGGMGILVAAMKIMGDDPKMLLAALAVAKVAGAMSLVSDVFLKMASLDWGATIRGMLAFAVSFGMVILAIKAVQKVRFDQLAGLGVVTGAMTQLANALKTMGSMSWDEIMRGVTALGASVAILGLALRAIQKIPWEAAASLAVVAGSIGVLAPALKTMSEIPIAGIVGALVLLAGVFVVIGVAAQVLSGSIPVLLGLGIALALIGVAVALVGAGVMAFAIGLTLLGTAAAVGGAGIVAMVSMLIGLIPMVITQIGLGIVAFLKLIASSGQAMFAAAETLLQSLLDALIAVLPKVAVLIMELITLILTILVNAVPQLIQAGITILIAFLTGIANNIGQVVDLAGQIIINFLNGLARQLPGIITAAVNVIVAFVNGIANNIGRIIQAGVNLILSFINGVADAIRNNGKAMGDAGYNLASAIIEGTVNGVKAMGGHVWDAIKDVAKGALDAAKKFLGINSPSKKFHEVGMGINEGLRDGINDYAYMSTKATENMGSGVLDTMGKTISGLGDMVGSGMDDLTPVITPVLDLSSVQKDSSQIGDLLQAAPIDLSGTVSQTSSASAGYSANQDLVAELAANAGTNVSFTQVNNSPKALTAAEIYRQTNNQLSQVRGALTNAN